MAPCHQLQRMHSALSVLEELLWCVAWACAAYSPYVGVDRGLGGTGGA
jgi:hypothetical protein